MKYNRKTKKKRKEKSQLFVWHRHDESENSYANNYSCKTQSIFNVNIGIKLIYQMNQ